MFQPSVWEKSESKGYDIPERRAIETRPAEARPALPGTQGRTRDAFRSGRPPVLNFCLCRRENRIHRWARIVLCVLVVSLNAIHLRAQQRPAGVSSALPADATLQQVAQFSGKTIGEVRVVTTSGEVISQNPAGLPVQPAKPYSAEEIRAAVRQLFASGNFADVVVEANESGGTLRLDFVVTRNLFFGVIRIDGLKEPPSDATAYASLRLRVGDAYSEEALNDAISNLKEALQLDGLYQAQVRADVMPDPPTHNMNINIAVIPGSRAKVGAIAVKNSTPYTDAELLSHSKLHAGKTLDSQKLQKAEERVRSYLTKQNFLGARVTLNRETFDAKTDSLPLQFEVIAGARVRVEVTGAKIPTKELKKRVPIFEEGAVDPDLLNEGKRSLRDYFERQGYFEVAVDYKLSEGESTEKKSPQTKEQLITYTIDRGRRQRLTGIAFEGNQYFGTDVLRMRLQMQPASFGSRGTFSRTLLDNDIASILGLYQANGFLGATVKNQIDQDYEGKEGDLFVHVKIHEGSQTLVGKLSLEGENKISEKDVMKLIDYSAGEPYSDYNVSVDRDNVLALYYNEGFPNAQFTSTVAEMAPETAAPNSSAITSGKKSNEAKPVVTERPRVAVMYHITEGEQVRVSAIVIAGYDHTRRSIIGREIPHIAGQPLREGEVIDTQRRLYNLGIFDRVDVAPQNPDGADTEKTLDVVVEEAKRYTIAYGAGFEVQRLSGSDNPAATSLEASPRLTFEVTKNNLTGRADTLSFKVRASALQWRGLLSYQKHDWLGNPHLSVQATLFTDKSRDVTTFTSTRYEGSLQLTQQISRATSLLYHYAYRRVLAADLLLNPEQVPLFSQPTLVSEFGISWVREHRNNPTDATAGTYNSVDLSIGGKAVGSSANWGRFFYQNSTYHQIFKWLTFARSTQFGIEQTFAGSESVDIPLPERFFAGGGNSIRGFGLNEAGPRDPDTGFPIGGDALIAFQQELRFPLKLPKFGTKVGGALFYDAGNVFSSVNKISLRYTPTGAETASGDLAYFSHTVGFGLRYLTPIGPIRVDFAYQINPPQFFACTISGTSCTDAPTLQRLPHFQFFFNLGSVF
jgi:outer membrane protein assembly factor BamA